MIEYICRGYLPKRAAIYKNVLLANHYKQPAATIDQLNRCRRDDEPYIVGLANSPRPGTTEKQKYNLSNGDVIEDVEIRTCGYRLTEAIASLPRDGQTYTVMCPECHTTSEILTLREGPYGG